LRRVILHRLRSLFRGSHANADLEREIDLHFEQLVKEAMASGMSESEARILARRQFGPVESTKEKCRDMRRVNLIENFIRDVRYALRMIRTKPGFSVPALLSLALGIGANIAIFSVVNAVLIRPLPYPEPEKLVGVFNSAAFASLFIKDWPLTLEMYPTYKENAQSFEEFGVWTVGAATVTGVADPEQVATVTMTHGVLRALGVGPYLGRWFSSSDEMRGSRKTVILSYKYWQRRFGGDKRILDRSVIIDFVPYQVIGIMPRGFEFLNLDPDIFLAQSVVSGAPGSQDADQSGLAKLKPGVTLAQANQDMARVLSIWGAGDSRRWKVLQGLRVKPNVHPLKQDVVGDVGAVLKILMGALAMVLLLVSTNVANLVLVRAQARRDEFAIRAALGAGWGQIARQVIIESLALAALGGAIGLAFAYVGLRLLVTHGPAALPRVAEISIDSTSVWFALACSLLSGILFGLTAFLKSGLKARIQNARVASQSAEQLRAQNVLVIAQVAIALVLLIGAGLLVRSFLALSAVRPGFTHPGQIQTIRLFIPEAQIRELERVAQMQADLLHNLATIPGVTAVGFADGLPLELEHKNGNPVSVEGQAPVGGAPNRTIKRISPGLFAALGARLIAGRDFAWDDRLSKRGVAIVSENMARENWGDPPNALGKRIRIGRDSPWSVIIGVAENIYDDGVDRRPPAIVYFPSVRRSVTFAIRSSRAGTEGLRKEITTKIHAVNASLPLAQVRTLRDLYRLTMARRSFALVLLGIAAVMAVTLSIIGVYGILAYAVAQRRREISIRVAVGAEPWTIEALFLRQGLIVMCIGGAIGLAAARGLSLWMTTLLFGVKPFDPITYGISGVVILAAALAASYVPARKAAFLNPIEALRAD
jgi:predicted permease